MPKLQSAKNNDNSVSMKEAFISVSPESKQRKRVKEESASSIRDFFWNYPNTLVGLIKVTSPISTILLFALLGFALFSFLRSDTFANKISSREQNYYVEGRVGAISTFNPLFSNQNDVDKAVQELLFEKFIYIDSNGDILPGIAKSWDVTNDGKTYDFHISLDHKWSDGELLTVEDVYFTFNTAIKLYSDQGYDTVASGLTDVEIEMVDVDSIRFTLPETNAIFPELASIYIVPKHILSEISLSEMPFDRFSRNPVGSGPYKILRSEPNMVYLQRSEFFKTKAVIPNIVMRVYSDVETLESAFRNGLLDAALLVDNGRSNFIKEYESYNFHTLNLPYRQRMMFFNLRKEKFQNKSLRKGIALLIDRQRLLDESGINGEIANGPIYNGSWAYSSIPEYPTYNTQEALNILKETGYKRNESNGYLEDEDGKLLTFTVSYLENSINEELMSTFKSLLDQEGVIVNLEPLNYSQLTQEILATRNFEVLMYEIEVTVDPDQYNLWHSLEKEYPNLNLSGYDFSRIDILLEDGRREINKKERKEAYGLFQKYLIQDMPAIFLYRPSYVYVVRDSVEGITYENLVRLEDVYRDVHSWQIKN